MASVDVPLRMPVPHRRRYLPTPLHVTFPPTPPHAGRGRDARVSATRIEKQQKTWTSPIEALLVAKRAAVLSGRDTDFVLLLTLAYTGMWWSEAIGLGPNAVRRQSPEPAVYVPAREGHRRQDSLVHGEDYVFLGPQRCHFRRSNYSERVVRPAADGWYPSRKGSSPRGRMPVLVDMDAAWPGQPLPPWPPVSLGEDYRPPRAGDGYVSRRRRPWRPGCPSRRT